VAAPRTLREVVNHHTAQPASQPTFSAHSLQGRSQAGPLECLQASCILNDMASVAGGGFLDAFTPPPCLGR